MSVSGVGGAGPILPPMGDASSGSQNIADLVQQMFSDAQSGSNFSQFQADAKALTSLLLPGSHGTTGIDYQDFKQPISIMLQPMLDASDSQSSFNSFHSKLSSDPTFASNYSTSMGYAEKLSDIMPSAPDHLTTHDAYYIPLYTIAGVLMSGSTDPAMYQTLENSYTSLAGMSMPTTVKMMFPTDEPSTSDSYADQYLQAWNGINSLLENAVDSHNGINSLMQDIQQPGNSQGQTIVDNFKTLISIIPEQKEIGG